MRRIRSGCCARATTGHAAAPPRAAMNARRLISHPSDKGRTLAHRQPRIVRRITCIGTMSELGHKRTFAVQNGMSALHLIATVKADIASQDECSSRQQRRSTNHARRCKPRHTHT